MELEWFWPAQGLLRHCLECYLVIRYLSCITHACSTGVGSLHDTQTDVHAPQAQPVGEARARLGYTRATLGKSNRPSTDDGPEF
eukprot:352598-Chlamydomonas_euryale.AAC.14